MKCMREYSFVVKVPLFAMDCFRSFAAWLIANPIHHLPHPTIRYSVNETGTTDEQSLLDRYGLRNYYGTFSFPNYLGEQRMYLNEVTFI